MHVTTLRAFTFTLYRRKHMSGPGDARHREGGGRDTDMFDVDVLESGRGAPNRRRVIKRGQGLLIYRRAMQNVQHLVGARLLF